MRKRTKERPLFGCKVVYQDIKKDIRKIANPLTFYDGIQCPL